MYALSLMNHTLIMQVSSTLKKMQSFKVDNFIIFFLLSFLWISMWTSTCAIQPLKMSIRVSIRDRRIRIRFRSNNKKIADESREKCSNMWQIWNRSKADQVNFAPGYFHLRKLPIVSSVACCAALRVTVVFDIRSKWRRARNETDYLYLYLYQLQLLGFEHVNRVTCVYIRTRSLFKIQNQMNTWIHEYHVISHKIYNQHNI